MLFELVVFQHQVGHHDLLVPQLEAEILDLADGCRPGPCSWLAESSRPQKAASVSFSSGSRQCLPPVERRDAVLAMESLRHNADLLLH